MKSETELLTASSVDKSAAETIISIDHLSKSFGSQEVLKDVSLRLFKEENLVVLGKSGTGKSVLIKCIVKLLEPDSGDLIVLGKNMKTLKGDELAEVREKVGFLFQSAALYDSMTVKQNLEFPLKRIKKEMKENEMLKKIEETLENVGLADALHKMPSQLSGGMRKRIGLARTLILDPAIMLYDEPTTGLDPITSAEISQLINEVKEKYHTSSIIITHDLGCARTTADRVIILNEGKVYIEGTIEQLEASDDPWIQSFFKR